MTAPSRAATFDMIRQATSITVPPRNAQQLLSRLAHKSRCRRTKWSGNPQVSAISFRFGKRTALAPRPLFRCGHRAASVVPWSARSMRFACLRFNRSLAAWLQPDGLYCRSSDACLMQNCSRPNSQMITSIPNEYVAHSPVFLGVSGERGKPIRNAR
jgi:hypothetical protein